MSWECENKRWVLGSFVLIGDQNVTDVKKDLLDPAIIGTTGILKAIKKNAPSVKRVVITSSFAAIVNGPKGNSWTEHTYR